MKRAIFQAAVALACTTFCNLAAADLIVGVAASSDNGSSFGTSIDAVVDGTGLVGGTPSLISDHDDTDPGNSWIGGTPTGAVTFDFGGLFWVEGFSFWNQNNGGPGAAGTSGINLLLIESSTDGALFLPVIGAPVSFAQVTTSGPVGPEVFGFAPILASHFRFNIVSNYGDPNTGFAEVQFQAAPEPNGSVLLMMGLCFLGWVPRVHERSTAGS